MPGPLQDLVSELARQFMGAGLWWAALALLVAVALLVVAVRRGWLKPTGPGDLPPRMPDVVPDDPKRPDATWGGNVNPTDPDRPGGGMEGG